MGDDLTILQLKERSAKDVKDEASETRWFEQKVLGTATKQVRDTLKFLDANPAIKVTNERGRGFEIRGDQLRSKTKVVVYLPGKVMPAIAKTTRHYMSRTGGCFIPRVERQRLLRGLSNASYSVRHSRLFWLPAKIA